MRYYITDCLGESHIDKLEKNGYHCYSMREQSPTRFSIELSACVNNIGDLITDEPIQFPDEDNFIENGDEFVRDLDRIPYEEIVALIGKW